jgi:hypothetical protein
MTFPWSRPSIYDLSHPANGKNATHFRAAGDCGVRKVEGMPPPRLQALAAVEKEKRLMGSKPGTEAQRLVTAESS